MEKAEKYTEGSEEPEKASGKRTHPNWSRKGAQESAR